MLAIIKFRVVVGLVLVLMLGWGLAIHGVNLGSKRAATIAELTRINGVLNGDLDAATKERDSLLVNKVTVEGSLKKREDDVKKREDDVKRREDEVKKREDEVTKRANEADQQPDPQAKPGG